MNQNGQVAGSMAQVARSAARAGARGAKRALQDPQGGGGQRRRRATLSESMEALPQVPGIPLLTVGGFVPNMPVIPGGGGTVAAVVAAVMAAGDRGARRAYRPKKAKQPRRTSAPEVFMGLGMVDTSRPLTENIPAPAAQGRNRSMRSGSNGPPAPQPPASTGERSDGQRRGYLITEPRSISDPLKQQVDGQRSTSPAVTDAAEGLSRNGTGTSSVGAV